MGLWWGVCHTLDHFVAAACDFLFCKLFFVSAARDHGDPDMPEFAVASVDDTLCVRMGRIVTRWTTVEKLISYLLGTVLNAKQGGMSIITSSVSTQRNQNGSERYWALTNMKRPKIRG